MVSTVLVWATLAPLLIAQTVFLAEALLGLLPAKKCAIVDASPSAVILMPAHNEALTIGFFLDALASSLGDRFRLLVVADNCTDSTADIARSKGIEVIERHDVTRMGKGFALAFGRDHLLGCTEDCVIVLDADCLIDRPSLTKLASVCVATRSVVQARVVFRPDRSVATKVQLSNFAFWFKNVVRQRGNRRLRGSAILNGTGMAFPSAIFRSLPLASADLVEDLALGLHLTRTGYRSQYLDAALVESVAAGEAATLQQRKRWEHGFLATSRAAALPALWEGLTTRNRALMQLALHLLVPPLALLCLLAVTAMPLLAAFATTTGDWIPLAVLAGLSIAMVIAIALGWVIDGWRWLSPRALLGVPLYVAWKVPLYLGFVRNRQTSWIRTERAADSKEPR